MRVGLRVYRSIRNPVKKYNNMIVNHHEKSGMKWVNSFERDNKTIVECTSTYLKDELLKIELEQNHINNVRYCGIFLRFDISCNYSNQKLVNRLQYNGAIVIVFGENSICIRPLMETPVGDVQKFVKILKFTLSELSMLEHTNNEEEEIWVCKNLSGF